MCYCEPFQMLFFCFFQSANFEKYNCPLEQEVWITNVLWKVFVKPIEVAKSTGKVGKLYVKF